MTQSQIDDAQDELDTESAKPKSIDDIDLDHRGRCANCGQAIPKQPTHVYAVRLLLNSGARRWHYSTPIDKRDAAREVRELKGTGHEALVLRVDEVEAHKLLVEAARRSKKKATAATPKKARAR